METNEIKSHEVFQKIVEAHAEVDRHKEIFKPLQNAAENGNEEAMYWLGQCYRLGIGIEKDSIRADYWEKQAVEHGFMIEMEEKDADALKKPGAGWYAERQGEVKKAEIKYRLSQSLITTGVGILLAWVCIMPFYLIWGKNLEGSALTLFWSLSGGFVIVLMVLFFLLGFQRAKRRIEKTRLYRQTPFYHAFGCELDQMTLDERWDYRLYKVMERGYRPLTWREEEWPAEEERGLMIPHWIYEEKQQKAQPEFVLISKKAVYIVRARHLTGRVQGDLKDAMWSLYSDGIKDRTAERIPNLVDENAKNVSIIKRELGRLCKASLDEVPFYNIICLNEAVDIKGLRRVSAPAHTFFVQGPAEKLRSSIMQWEDKMIPHNVNMDTIKAALKEIGAAFPKRSGWE